MGVHKEEEAWPWLGRAAGSPSLLAVSSQALHKNNARRCFQLLSHYNLDLTSTYSTVAYYGLWSNLIPVLVEDETVVADRSGRP